MDRIIFRAEAFEAYGLNKHRNFLKANTYNLKKNSEVFNFMNMALTAHNCENCAVFAIDYYGSMWVGIKNEDLDYDQMELFGKELFEVDYFAQVDSDYRFCCYGLMIETRPGVWKTIDA